MKKNRRMAPIVIDNKFHMVCPVEDICTKCKWYRTKQQNTKLRVYNCKKIGPKWVSSFFKDSKTPWWNTIAIPKSCPYKNIFVGRIKLENILI